MLRMGIEMKRLIKQSHISKHGSRNEKGDVVG